MIKYAFLTVLFYSTVIVVYGQEVHTPKIEIYLLKPSAFDSLPMEDFYFEPNKNDIVDTPIIKDQEILAYNFKKNENDEVSYSYIDIKEGAVTKIVELPIDLSHGRRFALTVNGLPVFGGYFWNGLSSFGCNWIAVVVFRDKERQTKLGLGKGVGYSKVFSEARKDPRGKADLLNAFNKSGRLRLIE